MVPSQRDSMHSKAKTPLTRDHLPMLSGTLPLTPHWPAHTITSMKLGSLDSVSSILSSQPLFSWPQLSAQSSPCHLTTSEPESWTSTAKLTETDSIIQAIWTYLPNNCFMNQTQDHCTLDFTLIFWELMFTHGSPSVLLNASLTAGRERQVSLNGKFDRNNLLNTHFFNVYAMLNKLFANWLIW